MASDCEEEDDGMRERKDRPRKRIAPVGCALFETVF
jgi:hypothetical protein